jgi:hypothetical protein
VSASVRDAEGRTFPDLRAGVWRHYKGYRYLALGYASASDAIAEGDPVVVYASLQAEGRTGEQPPLHVRSARGFWQRVPAPTPWDEVAAEGGMVPRFVYEGQVWLP